MLISGREAALRLAEIGMPRRQARLALGAGLAGEPVRTRSAVLYDSARVDELVGRPPVSPGALARECPGGLFVDRRVVDVRRLEVVGSAAVESVDLGWLSGAIFAINVRRDPLPYVATVCGFVVLGAEIIDIRPDGGGRHHLQLAPPGAWFEAWRGRRWRTGPGRAWSVVGRSRDQGVAVGD